eukprot:scpid109614/ scgid25850/ 
MRGHRRPYDHLQRTCAFPERFLGVAQLRAGNTINGRRSHSVAEHIKSIAAEFGIADKVTAIVHDEAANMVAAGRKLDWSSEICAAHRLQTCLRHAFDDAAPTKKLLA